MLPTIATLAALSRLALELSQYAFELLQLLGMPYRLRVFLQNPPRVYGLVQKNI